MLDELSKEWLLLELRHRVSKAASNDFWDLACSKFHNLMETKIAEMVYKKVPKFQNQRKKLFSMHIPKINLSIGYKDKTTNEVIVVEAEKTPVSYSPSDFIKLFEVATVKVIMIKKLLYDTITLNMGGG